MQDASGEISCSGGQAGVKEQEPRQEVSTRSTPWRVSCTQRSTHIACADKNERLLASCLHACPHVGNRMLPHLSFPPRDSPCSCRTRSALSPPRSQPRGSPHRSGSRATGRTRSPGGRQVRQGAAASSTPGRKSPAKTRTKGKRKLKTKRSKGTAQFCKELLQHA